MTALHKAVFLWPHADATSVILTGTFDQWSSSIHLTKGPSGFEGAVMIPYEDKVAYKFIVDGEWVVHDDQPTEADHVGNINNVYTAPKKPATLAPDEGESTSKIANFIVEIPALPVTTTSAPDKGAVDPNPARTLESVNGPTVLEGAKAALERSTYGTAAPKDDTIGEKFGTTFPQLVTDFADTIAARDGATSTLGYVASGLGAAIQSFVGVDPINADKIAYKSPAPDAQFEKPEVTMEEREGPTEDAEAPTEKPTKEPELPTGRAEGLIAEAECPTKEAEAPIKATETLTEEANGLTEKPEAPSEKPTEKPELPIGEAEVSTEEFELPTEVQGSTEEPNATEEPKTAEGPEAPLEVPPIYKPIVFGNAVPTTIAPIDGGSNITPESTQALVAIPSAIDTTSTSTPSETLVPIPFEPESPAPTTAAEPEAITASVSTSLGDNNNTDIATTAIQSDLPSAPTEVDTLTEELSTHIPLKIVSSPRSAAFATPVSLALASPEPTHQPATPTANLDPEPIAAESTFTTLVPGPAIGPEPSVAADRAVPGDNTVTSEVEASAPATQSEAPAVQTEELSTHVHVNIIQSEPKPVTSLLAVPAAEPSFSMTQSPEPMPIAADNANTTADEIKTSPTVLPEPPSEVPPASLEEAPLASEEPLTQAHINIAEPKQAPLASTLNVSIPEPTAPHTPAPEVGTAGDSAVPEAIPSASSIATADSKLEESIGSMTDGTTSMTKSTSTSKFSTHIQKQVFPSSESPGSTTTSTLSSKVGTTSSRKKKSSMFGKLKHIFGRDEKEKGKR